MTDQLRPLPSGPAEGRPAADHPAVRGAGGVHRRQFLRYGGLTVLGAVALAACADDPAATGQVPEFGAQLPTTTLPEVELTDATYLRTQTSIELLASATYRTLLDGDHLTDERITAMVQQMADRHDVLAANLQAATTGVGGTAYREANARLASVLIQPLLDEVTDQTMALALAHRLEELSADTAQRFVPLVTTGALRGALMSVGAVTARHAAVLALALPYGSVVPAAAAPIVPGPTTTMAPTTTAAGAAPPDPVYAAASAFGSTATAAGPSAYV